jgi:chemotaxis protein CheX
MKMALLVGIEALLKMLSAQTANPCGAASTVMNNVISSADVQKYVVEHLGTVFETMLSAKAVPTTEPDTSQFTLGRVSGSVGFAGKTVVGSVYLHVTEPFACQATAAMLGLPPEEITGTADVNDVIGEVTNMLAGGLKSWLCDAGATCALTTPAVIRGTSYTITTNPDVERIQIGFDCGESHGLAEIHIKFN